MKTITVNNSVYYVDDNNNKWSSLKYTEKKAESLSKHMYGSNQK